MKKLVTFAALSLMLAACASAPENKHSKGDAENAIAAAEHEAGRANKLGFLWRDVDDMIKKAKESAKEEKYDDAVKLATKAKEESSLSIEQANAQKNAAPDFR